MRLYTAMRHDCPNRLRRRRIPGRAGLDCAGVEGAGVGREPVKRRRHCNGREQSADCSLLRLCGLEQCFQVRVKRVQIAHLQGQPVLPCLQLSPSCVIPRLPVPATFKFLRDGWRNLAVIDTMPTNLDFLLQGLALRPHSVNRTLQHHGLVDSHLFLPYSSQCAPGNKIGRLTSLCACCVSRCFSATWALTQYHCDHHRHVSNASLTSRADRSDWFLARRSSVAVSASRARFFILCASSFHLAS